MDSQGRFIKDPVDLKSIFQDYPNLQMIRFPERESSLHLHVDQGNQVFTYQWTLKETFRLADQLNVEDLHDNQSYYGIRLKILYDLSLGWIYSSWNHETPLPWGKVEKAILKRSINFKHINGRFEGFSIYRNISNKSILEIFDKMKSHGTCTPKHLLLTYTDEYLTDLLSFMAPTLRNLELRLYRKRSLFTLQDVLRKIPWLFFRHIRYISIRCQRKFLKLDSKAAKLELESLEGIPEIQLENMSNMPSLVMKFMSTTVHVTVDHLRHERKVWEIFARKLGRNLAIVKVPTDSHYFPDGDPIEFDFYPRDRYRQLAVYLYLNKIYKTSCAIAKGFMSPNEGMMISDQALEKAKPFLKKTKN